MSKTMLITGATGLIGPRIVLALRSRGDDVIAVTRDDISTRLKLPDVKKIVNWNNLTSLNNESLHGVINLAGMNMGVKRWNEKIKKQLYYSRIHTTRKIVDFINSMTNKPEVLVNASGVDYYGDTGDRDIYEDSPPGTSFAAKLTADWEAEAQRAEKAGVRVVLVRTGFVLAPDSPALKKMALPFKFFAGGYPGNGKQYFSWIHINDIIGTYLFVLDHNDIRKAVNAISPNPLMMKDFCFELGKVLHRPSYFPVPAFLMKILFGEMSELVLTGRKALPKKLQHFGYEFQFPGALDALRTVI
jgi:uncharacterized protein (TIGR01777 family)